MPYAHHLPLLSTTRPSRPLPSRLHNASGNMNAFFLLLGGGQWCGEGLAAADVAYLVCTSLEPSVLALEADLLAFYHAELIAGLRKRFGVLAEGNTAACGVVRGTNDDGGPDPLGAAGFSRRQAEGVSRGQGTGCEGGRCDDGSGAGGGDRVASVASSDWHYPFEQFLDDYRVAFLDYMRCV